MFCEVKKSEIEELREEGENIKREIKEIKRILGISISQKPGCWYSSCEQSPVNSYLHADGLLKQLIEVNKLEPKEISAKPDSGILYYDAGRYPLGPITINDLIDIHIKNAQNKKEAESSLGKYVVDAAKLAESSMDNILQEIDRVSNNISERMLRAQERLSSSMHIEYFEQGELKAYSDCLAHAKRVKALIHAEKVYQEVKGNCEKRNQEEKMEEINKIATQLRGFAVECLAWGGSMESLFRREINLTDKIIDISKKEQK